MAQPKITADDPMELRLFHPDGKGVRGITLISSANGLILSVVALRGDGTRHAITTYALRNKDFLEQWLRAVETIRKYYSLELHDPLVKRMEAAHEVFMARYNLKTQTVVIREAVEA